MCGGCGLGSCGVAICGVGVLRCGGVVVWGVTLWGSHRVGELQCEEVVVSESCDVCELLCVAVIAVCG